MTDWFPWYPSLYEADTLHLTAAQDGIYRRLIDWYMKMRRPLPDNDQALAAIARIGLDEWLAAAEVVRPFFKSRDGKLHHKRCNTELDKQDRMQKIRSEVAKKGGEARAQKRRENNEISADGTQEAEMQQADITPPARMKQKRSTPEAGVQLASAPATGQDKTGEDKTESTPPPSSSSPRAEPEPAKVVVADFLRLRDQHWPNDSRLPAPTMSIEAEAVQFLAKGGTPEFVAEIVDRGMARAAAEGKGPPNSLKAYGHSIANAIAAYVKPVPAPEAMPDIPPFLRRPQPASTAPDWNGTYDGRATKLGENHPAITEHRHLTTWLERNHVWSQTWDDVWAGGREPKTEHEARTRKAALEPVIWPDQTPPTKPGPVSADPKPMEA